MTTKIAAVDRVEILTLQDNYIDLTSGDSTPVVRRAIPARGGRIGRSILAEHGFSSFLQPTTTDGVDRQLLFDFGYSPDGAASNADALGLDLSRVEALALSHGHFDHFGGLAALAKRVGKKDLPLALHPEAFRPGRHMKVSEAVNIFFPDLTGEALSSAGVAPVESAAPYPLCGGTMLFLGQVPRTTAYEKGAPNLFFQQDGQARQDTFEDDTAMVFHLKNKGLIVLSGCAHAGIINTVIHARAVTGVEKVHAVMGGFHLSGPGKEGLIRETVSAMADIAPDYVIPTHCTGRNAVLAFEKAMPEKVIINMAGTRLVFGA
jgi:7,8-dihydropterin-6-yl-methyl-4-(beta-D-ribofuranosyl)aminobenzene 5'-phosphate synthase